MNVLVLNVVFGILALLVGVGCPVIGLIWQHKEDQARLARRPATRIIRRPEVSRPAQRQAA